jgi:hypothetical protein
MNDKLGNNMEGSCSGLYKVNLRWAEHVACIGTRTVYKILVRKPKEKRPLGRPRHRLEDNGKIDLRKNSGKVDSYRALPLY